MSYVYLASPYSHRSEQIISERYHATLNYVNMTLETEPHHTVYSPIVHYHALAQKHRLPTDAAFWQARNEDMIAGAKELRILRLTGWEASKGIQLEIAYAESIGKKIVFADPLNS